jgi:hypothetical protein
MLFIYFLAAYKCAPNLINVNLNGEYLCANITDGSFHDRIYVEKPDSFKIVLVSFSVITVSATVICILRNFINHYKSKIHTNNSVQV